jgi:hypothetical protein
MVPDMSAITGLVASLNAATDITKSFLGLRDMTMVQGKVIELQAEIMSAQQSALAAQTAQSSLINRVSALEGEVADLKAWDAEKQNYNVQRFNPGVFLYVLKPEAQTSEPPHKLCPNCYVQGNKAILQTEWRDEHIEAMNCLRCKATFSIGERPPHQPRGDYDPLADFR